MAVIIGMDPGLKGGIAKFRGGKLVDALAMPTIDQKIMDFGTIVDYLSGADYVVLEEQFLKVAGGIAQRGMAKTMRNFGNLEGILRGLKVPHQVIKAQAWKRVVLRGTSKDKLAAIFHAQSRYPDVSLLPTPRSRVPSDGIADAICIGEYALTLYGTLEQNAA
jgi:hypothetical protein